MTRISKHRPVELRLWLFTMDALSRGGPLLHGAWMWALERASECVEWADADEFGSSAVEESW